MKTTLKKRKAMDYKIIIILSLIILKFHTLSAQNDSETRSFIKTLPVGRETILEVSNKYGTKSLLDSYGDIFNKGLKAALL